jgi:DNA-damage-inducible protein D
MKATDGKMRATDVADTQTLLRIIQSIPSPKAEPFKQWLAKVGYERMQEIADPSQGLDRARENWQKLGRSEKWIQQRMTGQETRNKLTDYWKETRINRRATMPTLRSHKHLQAILELAPHFFILTNYFKPLTRTNFFTTPTSELILISRLQAA